MNTQLYGAMSAAYDAGRQGYPDAAVQCVLDTLAPDGRLLDLGCGNGVSTRQLAAGSDAILGCDADGRMLQAARRHPQRLPYIAALAGALPFPSGHFAAIAAFGAFHWFRDAQSIAEIKRTLAAGGWFSVVNKNDVGRFRRVYGEVIRRAIGLTPKGPRADYQPADILRRAGFQRVRQQSFPTVEQFTLDEALTFVQSTRSWSYVSPQLRDAVLESMREALDPISADGRVERQLEVAVVQGQQP